MRVERVSTVTIIRVTATLWVEVTRALPPSDFSVVILRGSHVTDQINFQSNSNLPHPIPHFTPLTTPYLPPPH